MIEYQDLIDWAFKTLLSGAVLMAVRTLSKIGSNIDKIETSIEELNVNMAVIIEKTTNHEKVLDRHEIEIQNLQNIQK